MILDQLFENNEPGAMARAVTRRILLRHSDLLSRYGVEAVTQAIDDVTQGDDWEEIGSSDVSAYVRYVEDYLRDHHGSREEMADRRPFAEQGVSEMDSQGYRGHRGDEDPGKGPEKVVKPAKTKNVAKDTEKELTKAMDKAHKKGVSEGFIDTIKGAAKEFTRDSLQRKIKQAWENTFWPRHVEPALNRIQINGRPFRKMVLGEPRMIENDRSQRAILKQYTVNIVFPIDPQDWSGDEIQYLEGQLQDIQDGAWNPKVQGLGLVSFDQPMKSFQYTRGETPDLVIPVRITSLDINRGLVGEQGVAEGSGNNITYKQQRGKNKFSVEMLVDGKSAGIFQYDANSGRTIVELDPEYRGQGLGQRLILKGIYTAAMMGLDYREDESRTPAFDNAMDSLADNGYIVNDDEYWYVTDKGEQFLKQGVAENQRRFNNVNDDDLYAVDPRTKEIIAHLGNPYNNRNAVLIKKRQHEQQGHEVMSGMRAKFNRDVNEQQIQEDRVVPVVVIGPNNQKISRSVRLSPSTKDPVRDIMRYYARLGMELYSVAGQRVGAGAVSEGPAVDAYMSGKSPAIAHWADQLDRIAAKNESRSICPECGGAAYQSRFMAEKKDACYHKVRSRYKVWPSAYASGALVQCRKKGADNWGTGGGKK
jgi:GNAT superfamily N-acetyltransferase